MISPEDTLKAKILIVDDDPLSIRLLSSILIKAGYAHLSSTYDSRQACGMYKELNPDLLVLDLDMPQTSGFEIMHQLKQGRNDDYLPILVLSGAQDQESLIHAFEAGAKDYLIKPFERAEVLMRIRNILEVRLLHNEIRNHNRLLEFKVRERTQELNETQIDVIQRLARAVEYRDLETGMHIERMSLYAACLSEKLGLAKETCEMILTASPLHDIGKIGIPDNILQKPGRLTAQEWEIMKTHTTIGGELLSGGKSRFLHVAQEITLTHHEWWNGKGYPLGLRQEEIPLPGRICGLCDVFDALTSRRPYKQPWSIERSAEEIKKGRETHFDPKLVDCFLDNLPQFAHIKEKYMDPA